jgi:hypothetical protein
LQLDHLTPPVTASFGESGVRQHQRATLDALYSAADQAL